MHFDPLNTSWAFVSPDGSRVVFGALQQVGAQKHWHIIARNVRTNGFSRVDISPSGKLADGDTRPLGLSADGLHVLFGTFARDFGTPGVYERDLTTHRTVYVTADSGRWIGVSRDGRFVSYVGGGGGKHPQIWLRDLAAQKNVLVSRATDGNPGNGDSLAADVSPDGSHVAFSSSSDNLVPSDTNNKRDIFLWTRNTGAIKRISVTSDGKQFDLGSASPRFTTDGTHVGFASDEQLTSDACKGGVDGVNDSDGGRNGYVLDLASGAIAHPKQNCNTGTAGEIAVIGSNGGATLAVGTVYDISILDVRTRSTDRQPPDMIYGVPTSITANGRFVGIDHYDPVDNPPRDRYAGALIWDLTHARPAAAWLVQTTA
jgi:hypothetical protein